MITQTSETAIRLLVYMANRQETQPVAVHQVAADIGAAPTYAAKIVGTLVQAGILLSQRGAKGGVELAKDTTEIRMLDIVQACQNLVTEIYCQPAEKGSCQVCGYHTAMGQLHQSVLAVLGTWTLANLAQKPVGTVEGQVHSVCTMVEGLKT
jgi:Rrf2 family protein